ncbi:MAG: hypothetical protein JWN03_9113 [Nocardia sp.]|uniref:HNH endonuclease signature motif containing protein n=1 Tax=Nocardia sp. TaxID=1821 RepID=UPI00261BC132|nr:HNH endonuclease signature motif containing protein [Nocardia sp.]MCU1648838.1 hypothetical protein [Nocardia sp.]
MSECTAEELTSYELVERLQAVHSAVAMAQAEEVALTTQLYRLRRSQQLEFGVAALYAGESTATEIAMNLHVSQRLADGQIALGLDLDDRLPLTQEAFTQGRLDLGRVRAIHDTLINAPDALVTALEPRIVDYAQSRDPGQVKRAIRKWLLEIDPAGQARRRKEAEAERYVSVQAADNGTTILDGVLSAAGGRTLYERLREMAITQCCGRDPRTMNQRRADALVALADGTGHLSCQCTHPDCPRSDTPVHEPRRALIQVGVSAQSLAGLADNPALLAGFGAIDADLARTLARHATFQILHENTTGNTPSQAGAASAVGENSGATVTTPGTDSADNAAAQRYRPGLPLAARVRALAGTCRAPGCQVPAAASDLDHQQRFDHHAPASGGATTEENLGARCRRHHRLKTLADNDRNGWTVIHHPDRRIEWRTPTGGSITTTPEGARFLFPHLAIPPTAGSIPQPDPVTPLVNPGPATNTLIELIHVYVPPGERRRAISRRHSNSSPGEPVLVGPNLEVHAGHRVSDNDAPPF